MKEAMGDFERVTGSHSAREVETEEEESVDVISRRPRCLQPMTTN